MHAREAQERAAGQEGPQDGHPVALDAERRALE
jgi:hypothetical protein